MEILIKLAEALLAAFLRVVLVASKRPSAESKSYS
jgi:hypothetical protein